jgi:hypothetical protein
VRRLFFEKGRHKYAEDTVILKSVVTPITIEIVPTLAVVDIANADEHLLTMMRVVAWLRKFKLKPSQCLGAHRTPWVYETRCLDLR